MSPFESIILTRRQALAAAGGLASLALAACGGTSEADQSANTAPQTTSEPEAAQDSVADETPHVAASAGSSLVVYFSWSGNTRSMAERIAEVSGAGLWELVPEEPYPEVYEECTDEARAEQQAGTLRAYQGDVEDWDDIDTVFIGYPIWWMDMPQITKAFVANHDWGGKTVVPFCSYFSSGWSGTPDALGKTCAGATLLDGIALAQGDLPGALDDINAWCAGLKLA